MTDEQTIQRLQDNVKLLEQRNEDLQDEVESMRKQLNDAEAERDVAMAKVGRHITVADPESASYKIGFHNGAHQMKRHIVGQIDGFKGRMDDVHIEPN